MRSAIFCKADWRNDGISIFILHIYDLSLFYSTFIKEISSRVVICSYYDINTWGCSERIYCQESAGMTTFSCFFKAFLGGVEGFGRNIIAFVNFILLLVVYVFGVGITSFVAKFIFGKKFLEKKPLGNQRTYWSEMSFDHEEDSYYRQF